MASPRARAQEAEVSRAMLACVEGRGETWWSAWDALQWSPVGLLDGMPFRGTDRFALAALSLSRGHSDRRWAYEDELEAHGYQARRGSRGALVGVREGRGPRMVVNAENVVRARAKGVRHGAPAPDERARPPMTDRHIALATSALWEEVDSAIKTGERGLSRVQPDVWPLVATLACVMALSDLGIVPRDAYLMGGEPVAHAPTAQILRKLTDEPVRLMECADRAEETASELGGTLAQAIEDADEESRARSSRAAIEVPEAAEREGLGASANTTHVRPPLRKPSILPFGRYTLGDVVAEAQRASDVLASGTSGRR